MAQKTKSYYLPPWRSITIGVILIITGLRIIFGGIKLDRSLWENLQRVFISFEGLFDFLTSIIFLLFKAGFLAGGYMLVNWRKGVKMNWFVYPRHKYCAKAKHLQSCF